MGTRGILLRALAEHSWPRRRPLRVLELGAGDGRQLLEVARRLQPRWSDVQLTLLDQQALVSQATQQAYRAVGWQVQVCVGDALDRALWRPDPTCATVRRWDLVLSNLFLHHFTDAPLRALMADLAASTNCLLAYEPRRAPLALLGSRLVGLLGVNQVTRTDAVRSVQAGFRAQELSALWPDAGQAGTAGAVWRLRDYPAGLFSQVFAAQRLGLAP
jgi:SAM-dependent methyltransferase